MRPPLHVWACNAYPPNTGSTFTLLIKDGEEVGKNINDNNNYRRRRGGERGKIKMKTKYNRWLMLLQWLGENEEVVDGAVYSQRDAHRTEKKHPSSNAQQASKM